MQNLFLCQHDNALNMKQAHFKFGVVDHNWTAQNPGFNPIHHLWGELEERLQARPHHPTSFPSPKTGPQLSALFSAQCSVLHNRTRKSLSLLSICSDELQFKITKLTCSILWSCCRFLRIHETLLCPTFPFMLFLLHPFLSALRHLILNNVSHIQVTIQADCMLYYLHLSISLLWN